MRPQTTRVRAWGSGAARIHNAAGRSLTGLRGLRTVVRQLSRRYRPSGSRAPPDAALPEDVGLRLLRPADRRPQLTRQSWLLA